MNHAKQLRAFAERCMASDAERAGLRAAADEIERLRAVIINVALTIGHDTSPLLSE